MSTLTLVPPPKHRMDFSGTKAQLDFWRDQKAGEVAFIGPLGSGKTYALAIKQMFLRLNNPHSDSILLVPTYAMAERIHKREWPPIWQSFGFAVRVDEKRQAFVWEDIGAVTWIISAEEPDRMKGINAGDACVDEPGQISREAYDVLVTRVRHPKAFIRQTALGGTPEGINWLADLFANPDGTQRRTIWATGWHKDCAHYPETLKRVYGYDQALLDTYARGKFTSLFGGGCYGSFRPHKHVTERVEYDRNLELVLACDFNVDSMRWCVLQLTFDEIRVVDEIALGRNCNTEQAAREFASRYRGHGAEVVITGDASGQARKTSGSAVDYQIATEVLRTARLSTRLHVSAANPRQRERVDSVNYHLSGRGRAVYIHPRCKELILDLERNVWKQGTSDIDKSDPMRTHAADAFGYAVWNLARPLVSLRDVAARPIPMHHDPIMEAVY